MTSPLEFTSANSELAGAGVYIRNRPWIDDTPVSFYFREIHGRLLRHVAHEKISVKGWSLDMLGSFKSQLEASETFDGQRISWLLRHNPDLITLIEVVDGWAEILTAGKDYQAVHETCAVIARQVGEEADSAIVPITFWASDPDKYPKAMMRKLEAPSWESLQDNYDTGVVEGVEKLLALRDCPKERMILWHGAPGTGKTHALRALLREWQPWCDAAFITDPERFVGGSPTYIFDVANFGGGRTASEARQRSKLIILEDAGELMTTEARVTTGQGLSRLLNMTDGLLGQGLKVMILITTNEPLRAMHPAVIRPGRCLSEMEFGTLSAGQANRWLRERGSKAQVLGSATLAQLYSMLG